MILHFLKKFFHYRITARHAKIASFSICFFCLPFVWGCAGTQEHIYHPRPVSSKELQGRAFTVLPPAKEEITLADTEVISNNLSAHNNPPVSVIQQLLPKQLSSCIKAAIPSPLLRYASADSLRFDYGLSSRDFINIVQTIDDDTTTFQFTLPSQKYLLQQGITPDLALAFTKLYFSKELNTEGYYQDGLFHGGATPILKATYNFVLFDYQKQECLFCGETSASVTVVNGVTAASWNALFDKIGAKFINDSPLANFLTKQPK